MNKKCNTIQFFAMKTFEIVSKYKNMTFNLISRQNYAQKMFRHQITKGFQSMREYSREYLAFQLFHKCVCIYLLLCFLKMILGHYFNFIVIWRFLFYFLYF